MENSGIVTDCIYEDMTSTSPLTDDGYMTSSGSCATSSASARPRMTSKGVGRAQQAPISVYMNMENQARDQEATLTPSSRVNPTPTCSPFVARETSRTDAVTRETSRTDSVTRETSVESDITLQQAPNYEYIDIEIRDRGQETPVIPPPKLPSRNNNRPDKPPKPTKPIELSSPLPGRDRFNLGLKSYQEQMRLQKEMMLNFSAAVLETSSSDLLPARTFMNTTV